MSWEIRENETYGFQEVVPRPSAEELRQYYADKYYEGGSIYQTSYTEEERRYLTNKIAQKDEALKSYLLGDQTTSLLDVGCGEGFTLAYYLAKGWEVRGIDFTDTGLNQFHPELRDRVTVGNIFDEMDRLCREENRFDVIWLDNVLEHVADPVRLIKTCHLLCAPNGVLVVEVPNDFSGLQKALSDRNRVSKKYWIAHPDHLNYFTRTSLIRLCEGNGWDMGRVLGDFPIEWFLMNGHSNYVEDRSKGRAAHEARIFLENFLHREVEEPDVLNGFFEALAKTGQGRQLIGFFIRV
ncbi:MAG: class I SAM-dependent methyltransferase [Verrucomicrobiota bacterium]